MPQFRITTVPAVIEAPRRAVVPPIVGVADPGQHFPIDMRTMKRVGPGRRGDPIAVPLTALEQLREATLKEGDAEGFREVASRFLIEVGLDPEDDPDHLERELRARFSVPERRDLTFFFDERDFRLVDLPDELWMREFLAIDTATDQGFFEFLINWGPLVLPQQLLNSPDVAHLRWRSSRGSVVLGGEESHSQLPQSNHRAAVYQTLSNALGDRHPGDLEEQMVWTPGSGDESVMVDATGYSAEFQLLLIDLYQAVFTTLVQLQPEDLTPEALTAAPRSALAEIWAARDLPQPETLLQVVDSAIDAVSSAAAAFGPRAEFNHPDSGERGLSVGQPIPRILAAMCLQALAWLAEGVPARRCANETCGKWFTHQRGRAQFGQYRSAGVRYCSASCAKAQAQRQYRRRHRQK